MLEISLSYAAVLSFKRRSTLFNDKDDPSPTLLNLRLYENVFLTVDQARIIDALSYFVQTQPVNVLLLINNDLFVAADGGRFLLLRSMTCLVCPELTAVVAHYHVEEASKEITKPDTSSTSTSCTPKTVSSGSSTVTIGCKVLITKTGSIKRMLLPPPSRETVKTPRTVQVMIVDPSKRSKSLATTACLIIQRNFRNDKRKEEYRIEEYVEEQSGSCDESSDEEDTQDSYAQLLAQIGKSTSSVAKATPSHPIPKGPLNKNNSPIPSILLDSETRGESAMDTFIPLIPLEEGFRKRKRNVQIVKKGGPPPTPIKTAIKRTNPSSSVKAPIPPSSNELNVEKSDMSFAVKVDASTAPVVIPPKDPPLVEEQHPPPTSLEIEKVDVAAVAESDSLTAQNFIRQRVPHSMTAQPSATTIHKTGGADVPTAKDAPIVTKQDDSSLGKAPTPQVTGLGFLDCCVIL